MSRTERQSSVETNRRKEVSRCRTGPTEGPSTRERQRGCTESRVGRGPSASCRPARSHLCLHRSPAGLRGRGRPQRPGMPARSEPRPHLVVLHVSVGPVFQQQKRRLHVVDSRCPVKGRFSCKRNVRVRGLHKRTRPAPRVRKSAPHGAQGQTPSMPSFPRSRRTACRRLCLQRTSRD